MGTGCARGFLASFDAAWMIKQWSLNRDDGLGKIKTQIQSTPLYSDRTAKNRTKHNYQNFSGLFGQGLGTHLFVKVSRPDSEVSFSVFE